MCQFPKRCAVRRKADAYDDIRFRANFMLVQAEELSKAPLESVAGDGVAYSLGSGNPNTSTRKVGMVVRPQSREKGEVLAAVSPALPARADKVVVSL